MSNSNNSGPVVIAQPAQSGQAITYNGTTWTFVTTTAPTLTTVPVQIAIDFGDTVPAASEKKINKEGYFCMKCKDHYPFSEPNQKDGTLICYACRH